jgi:HD-GYP domain-containing protein (c-di-GMP phosphodiesterase class II)
MGPAPRDRLLAAWQLYAALPIVAPRAPSPAEGSQRLDDEQRLRSLAARALERARQNAGTREETPARWALQMALHGAENWDGSGRPLGLQGRDIPLPARLMHLVNSYGILRASSALGGAQLSAGAALARMEASCHHEFDPQLFAALKAVTQQEAAAAAVCA